MGRIGEHSRTVLHLSCLITDPSTLLRDPWAKAIAVLEAGKKIMHP